LFICINIHSSNSIQIELLIYHVDQTKKYGNAAEKTDNDIQMEFVKEKYSEFLDFLMLAVLHPDDINFIRNNVLSQSYRNASNLDKIVEHTNKHVNETWNNFSQNSNDVRNLYNTKTHIKTIYNLLQRDSKHAVFCCYNK